jgi:hypothetical protein
MSCAVHFIGWTQIRVGAFGRKRSGDLKLVNDRACLFDGIERFDRGELRRGSSSVRFVSRFVLIVDDEDSRNASIMGVSAGTPQGAVVRGMSVPTPAEAE